MSEWGGWYYALLEVWMDKIVLWKNWTAEWVIIASNTIWHQTTKIANRSRQILCKFDSTTGTFTVPPDRFFYFSTYLVVENGEWGHFDLELTGEVTFSIDLDLEESLADEG